jgi:hypothetical protein
MPANIYRGIVKVSPEHLAHPSGHTAAGARKPAPGFKAHKALNLTNHGGRTIHDLSFQIFYLDGSRWAASDMQNIDAALSGALSDPHLNNVIQQYFPNGGPITSNFKGSQALHTSVGATFTRDSINPVLQGLLDAGTLAGTDFDNTVICLMLPPGAILTTDAAGGVGHEKGGDPDDKDSSQQGLGGYHGSCHLTGGQRVYFAVAVYSQFINGKPNGIPIWPDSWKNVVATHYHELNEARTDPDVEEAIRTNNDALLGWYSDAKDGGEIGDIPINVAGANIRNVMVEVSLVKGGTAPVQLMWSNAVGGPEMPFA